MNPDRLRLVKSQVDQLSVDDDDAGDDGDTIAFMTDPVARPELDAKLELIETRMDARVQRIESQVERSIESTDRAVEFVRSSLVAFRDENKETRSAIAAAKWWAVGTGLVVMIGVWQIVTAVNQGIIAAFESGRITGEAQSKAAVKGDLTTAPPVASDPPKK